MCLYLFYTRISPLYIFDLDDWYYVSFFRHPLPDVKQLNPIKILPETWMPLVSYLATFLIYPFTGDYYAALAVGYALTLSAMITLYVLSVIMALSKWYENQSIGRQMAFGTIFLLFHFTLFLVPGKASDQLFFATDVTCVFNYILPALLNYILWMYFFDQDRKWKPLKPEAMGLLLLCMYLAVFSNLFHSIILMSLFGMQLLFALVQGIRENIQQKKPWISPAFILSYLKVHYPKLLALLAWFVSMAFQMGRRSEDISGQMQLGMILRAFWELITVRLNIWFRLAVLGINLAAVIFAYHRRDNKFLIKWLQILGCTGLSIVYLMLVTGKLSDFYFLRSDVIISWMGMVIFMTMFSLAYLVQKQPKARCMVPVLLVGLLAMALLHQSGYQQYNVPRLPSAVIKAIDDDILRQVKAAEEAGQDTVQLLLPESLSDKQWPLDVEMTSERIADSLFWQGIIQQEIKVTVIPSPEKDIEFGLK